MITLVKGKKMLTRTKGSGPLLLLVVCTVLAGCSAPDNADLHSRLNQIKSRPPGKIKPLPAFKAYETFAYEAMDEKSPFTIFDGGVETGDVSEVMASPLQGRNLEALEQYPLDTLRYVGQLTTDGREWAIITSPDLVVHRVTVGNHVGKNYGEILGILEEKIVIEETIPDGMGGWIKREAGLSLTE